MQSGFGTSPQNVLGTTRPFARDEVIDFARIQVSAEVFAQVGDGFCVAQYRACCAAMPVCNLLNQCGR